MLVVMAVDLKGPSRKDGAPALSKDIDVAIGKRLRFYRSQRGVSQTELGAHVGLTFQQVQKYEKGSNRLSTSRLLQFASFLEISPEAFLTGLIPSSAKRPDPIEEVRDALLKPHALELVREFSAIKSKAVRKSVVELVRAFNASP